MYADDPHHASCCFIVVYAAVLSVKPFGHQEWCYHLFAPTSASGRARLATPNVYLAMSLFRGLSGGRPFDNIQEFEQACRVPMSPDKNGQHQPGYRHDFPDPTHFVYLLPPADAEAQQVRLH